MSRNHPEKRPFLHSTSDTDSDVDNEQGWADVGLANQLGRGSYGTPKKNSYVTHDFSVFWAVKPDPSQTQATSESNLLRNKEPRDEQQSEGSSRHPIESSAPFTQGSPSESSYRSQEPTSQANVSQSDPCGVDTSGRDSHIESGMERILPQMLPFENEGLAVIETNASIFSELEKWPSPQFSSSSIGVLEDVSLGGETNINSNLESESSKDVIPSKTGKVGEDQHERSSHYSAIARQPSIESTFKEINLLREEIIGNRSGIQSPRPSILEMEISTISGMGETSHYVDDNEKQSLSCVDPFGDGGENNSSLDIENESQSFSKSFLNTEIQGSLLREEIIGRDDYIDKDSDKLLPLQSPILQMQTYEESVTKRTSDIVDSSDTHNNSEIQPLQSSNIEMDISRKSGMGQTSQSVDINEKQSFSYFDCFEEEDEKNSSIGTENERQSFSKSLSNTETQGDLSRENNSGRDNKKNIDENNDKQLSLQSPLLQIETTKEPDKGRTTHIVDANEQWSVLYLDPLEDEGMKSSIGGGTESESFSIPPILDTDTRGDLTLREETSGVVSYINNSNEKQISLQFPVTKMETIKVSSTGRTSHTSLNDQKWSISHLDSLGDRGEKSSSIDSENERMSFSRFPLLCTETVGELVREETIVPINYSGEKQTSVESSIVEMEAFGGSVEGQASHIFRGDVRWSVSYLDSLGHEGEHNTSTGSQNEQHSFSKSPPLDTSLDSETLRDLVREETNERNSYLNDSREQQKPLQPVFMEMKTFEGPGRAETSQTVDGNEKWSLLCLDPLGDEGEKSSSLGSGNERKSFSKSHLSDIETLGEQTCARHGHVGGISERELLPKPKLIPELIDIDVERESTIELRKAHNNVKSARSFEIMRESSLELPPCPQQELAGVPMTFDRQTSHLDIPSNVNVGEDLIYLVKGNERTPLGKECLLDEQPSPLTHSRRTSVNSAGNERRPSGKELAIDEQLEPLRDMKRASTMFGHRVSHLPSTSDMDRGLESIPDRASGRGSLNQSSRLRSQIVSVPYEAESDGQNKERDELEEDDTSRHISSHRRSSIAAQVGERFPPEWALLLLGCFLGLATGLSVVLFNKGVHFIHDVAWAGTPKDGAAWFRLQPLIDIWHRVLLLPVVGGVVVGMMHAVLVILDQIRASKPPQPRHTIDWLAGIKPAMKAGQAMVTLGTGCSLGPEGPSVDIGKAWANGLATVMKNNKERRIALVAAGAAAGISAGFNAPVSGMFFAIETILRPQKAENSPPLTTAMIILASVISSTVSEIVLEETPAFTVPTYELPSAAELPLYLILGGLCGVVSVIFVRLTTYFTELFEFLRDQIGVPPTVTPAIGGLVTGVIALKYPGVLYWGFYNVDEILHSGKSAIAPGAGLVTQLICAKVVATAFSKGSGLVGGVYAPSLFIGAAVGSVSGTIAGKIIDAALPGLDTLAHPQAYALVGMAALLAAVCSVPLTSVLLLFELTKDYHILLPLMGGIGVAIWVAAVAKQTTEKHFATSVPFGGRSFQPLGTDEEGVPDHNGHEQLVWRRTGRGTEVELCRLGDYEGRNVVSDTELKDKIKVSQAMSKTFVKVQAIATVKETIGQILIKQQRCALVVDENDLLEGIFTFSDLEKEVMRAAESSYQGHRAVVDVDKILVAAMCSGKGDNQGQDTDLVVCFPDMSLRAVLEIMDSSGFKQLPVVARAGKRWQDEGRHVVGLIYRDAIPPCVREEASKQIASILAKDEEDDDGPLLDGH